MGCHNFFLWCCVKILKKGNWERKRFLLTPASGQGSCGAVGVWGSRSHHVVVERSIKWWTHDIFHFSLVLYTMGSSQQRIAPPRVKSVFSDHLRTSRPFHTRVPGGPSPVDPDSTTLINDIDHHTVISWFWCFSSYLGGGDGGGQFFLWVCVFMQWLSNPKPHTGQVICHWAHLQLCFLVLCSRDSQYSPGWPHHCGSSLSDCWEH